MNEITQEILKELFVYEPENGVLRNRVARSNNVKPGSEAGSLTPNGYLRAKVFGKKYLVHRLIWMYVHGAWPKELIDHINGNRQDNRACNLRECCAAQNIANSKLRTDNTTGYKGVYWSPQKQKWRAEVTRNKKTHRLGYFETIDAAVLEASIARAELHGDFAKAA